jgi:hypothetical protein
MPSWWPRRPGSGRDEVIGFLGVFHTPSGDVAPTGRAVELPWAAVYATDGEMLRSEHLFFDQMDLRGQLGLLPG